MPDNPRGRPVLWKSGSGPSAGCSICALHRRGPGESQAAAQTGHIDIGGIQICGDCAAAIKAVTP